MTRPEAVVFNPIDFADFRLQLDERHTFSSLRQQLLVIEAKRIAWDNYVPQLAPLFHGVRTGFVLFRPWAPGSAEKEKAFDAEFGEASHSIKKTRFALLRRGTDLKRVLALRQRIGGRNSGPWLIGTTLEDETFTDYIERQNVAADHLSFVAAGIADAISSALILEEADDSLLMTKYSDDVAIDVTRILARMVSDGVSVQYRRRLLRS
jgi:hypothetical protein